MRPKHNYNNAFRSPALKIITGIISPLSFVPDIKTNSINRIKPAVKIHTFILK